MFTTNPRPRVPGIGPGPGTGPDLWYEAGYWPWPGTIPGFGPGPYDSADFNNVRANIFFRPGFGRFPFFFFPPFFFPPSRRRRRFFW